MEQQKTKVINNFSGRLTRLKNGDLNSGFANYENSFGYDPFTEPMTLQWFQQPASIASSSSGLSDLVMGMLPVFDIVNDVQYVVGVGSTGKLYQIQVNSGAPGGSNVDSVVGVTSVFGTYSFGAGMAVFGDVQRLYLGADSAVVSASLVGGLPNGQTATVVSNNLVSNTARPLKTFIGKLAFGNGPTIGTINQVGVVTSSIFTVNANQGAIYSELSPALGTNEFVRDIDVSIDRNYLLISSSTMPNEQLTSPPDDRQNGGVSESGVYGWNGTDGTVTIATSLPSYTVSALQTYLQKNMFFANDAFGASINDGVQKIVTLPNTKAPVPNATASNGNFLTWATTETNSSRSSVHGSLFYYGALDRENPEGLYRVAKFNPTLNNGFMYQAPVNLLVGSQSFGVNTGINAVGVTGTGKHYVSLFNINATNNTPTATGTSHIYRFALTNSGIPQLGVYQTQTQLFEKKIGLSEIRVYAKNPTAGASFQLDLIGADEEVVTDGTFTWTYGDPIEGGTRIQFDPSVETLYGLGLRITNTGTTNMKIKKIEIDYDPEGK